MGDSCSFSFEGDDSPELSNYWDKERNRTRGRRKIVPGQDDSLAKAPPEWLDTMFPTVSYENALKALEGRIGEIKSTSPWEAEGTITGRITTDKPNIKVISKSPEAQMEEAITWNCPFCNTKALQRYDVEAGKVRCKKCDLIMSIGIVFRGGLDG